MKYHILFDGKKIRKMKTICINCQILFSGENKKVFAVHSMDS